MLNRALREKLFNVIVLQEEMLTAIRIFVELNKDNVDACETDYIEMQDCYQIVTTH